MVKYGKKHQEPCGWCEYCEKALFAGDNVLNVNRFATAQAYICMACFCEAGKKELAEMLGANFEQLEEQ